jgi:hypothetical protein
LAVSLRTPTFFTASSAKCLSAPASTGSQDRFGNPCYSLGFAGSPPTYERPVIFLKEPEKKVFLDPGQCLSSNLWIIY